MTLAILTQPNEGANLHRLRAFIEFLESRLAADDFAEAHSLLVAAWSPAHAQLRHAQGRGHNGPA